MKERASKQGEGENKSDVSKIDNRRRGDRKKLQQTHALHEHQQQQLCRQQRRGSFRRWVRSGVQMVDGSVVSMIRFRFYEHLIVDPSVRGGSQKSKVSAIVLTPFEVQYRI